MEDRFSSYKCDDVFSSSVKPETENHVLMIYAYNYLATLYVLWAGALDPPPTVANVPAGQAGGVCLAEATCEVDSGLMCFTELDVCGPPSRYDSKVAGW
jgi:hypothetical protein